MFWTNAAYAMGASAQGQEGAAGGLMSMAPILLMFVIFYFLLIRPQQKKNKQHKAMLASLKPGDKVVTVGGIYGRIIKIDDEKAVLDLGDSKVTVGRGYIAGPTVTGVAQSKKDSGDKKTKDKDESKDSGSDSSDSN